MVIIIYNNIIFMWEKSSFPYHLILFLSIIILAVGIYSATTPTTTTKNWANSYSFDDEFYSSKTNSYFRKNNIRWRLMLPLVGENVPSGREMPPVDGKRGTRTTSSSRHPAVKITLRQLMRNFISTCKNIVLIIVEEQLTNSSFA